jgi:hypothetical protein
MTNHSTQNVGNAGEYYIAARLSAENFITTITLGRAQRYDLLVVNPAQQPLKLSVKTRLHDDTESFLLHANDENEPADDLFYCFVRLNNFESEPDFWIVPSKRVVEVISNLHLSYIESHNDNTMRAFFTCSPDKYATALPSNWIDEVNGYYKNIEQLKKLF